MNLTELYSATVPAVLGFISKTAISGAHPPLFPEIFGTGFLVDPSGIAVTNRHVIEAFRSVPQHPERKENPVAAVLFYFDDALEGCAMLVADIHSCHVLGDFSSSGTWYGNNAPDLGFVQLCLSDCPALQLAKDAGYLQVGMDIATIGYPMGTLPLVALGRLNQISPFIRRGIVSSVFPFPVSQPHGFSIDIMQQGGSSGSPILSPSGGQVVGMMWGGIPEHKIAQSDAATLLYSVNTNISLAEPAHILKEALVHYMEHRPQPSNKFKTYGERVEMSRSNADPSMIWEKFTLG